LGAEGNAARCPECRGSLGSLKLWESLCKLYCPGKLEGAELLGLPDRLVKEVVERHDREDEGNLTSSPKVD
jgi:hypothetical protein